MLSRAKLIDLSECIQISRLIVTIILVVSGIGVGETKLNWNSW